MPSKLPSFRLRPVAALVLGLSAWAAQAAYADSDLPANTLKEVSVQADAPKDGSAEAGYKVENVKNVGPWGEKKLLDTPYSLTVSGNDLIENTVSGNPDNLYRMNPLIQVTSPTGVNDAPGITQRGLLNTGNDLVDGMRYYWNFAPSIENVESIDVLSGLSGFMYGSADVGGAINYMTKRPTATPLRSLTVGNYGGSQYFAHADLGGPIGQEGKFAYRVNLLGQDGNTVIQDQSLSRDLISGALDWHITNELLAQINAYTSYYKISGRQSTWNFASGLSGTPSAPDNKRLWAPTGTFNEVQTNGIGAKLTYDINDNYTLRAAYSYESDDRKLIYAFNTINSSGTTYNMSTQALNNDFINYSGYAYLDAKFDALGAHHKVTLGLNAFEANFSPYVFAGSTSTGAKSYTNLNLSDPNSATVALASINLDSGTKVTTSKAANTNYVLGDDVKFNDQWSALVGISNVDVVAKNYSTAGALTTQYDKSKISPNISVLYKPVPSITTYATYIEALEQGTIVGSTYKNAGAILDPLVSKQYELGLKSEVGKMLLTTALFRIDRANQYSDNGTVTGTYVQDGLQVNEGIEFTASGKATDNLTLVGGATWMSLKVQDTNTPSLVGKEPVNAAEQMAKVYAEYNLPAVQGLTLTGGVYYTGSSYADTLNVYALPSYTTLDVGARYTTKAIGNNETVFRVNVTNVTDVNYFYASNYLGTPRTIAFSATMKF
jgi:iron complex outermembrane receptor protein